VTVATLSQDVRYAIRRIKDAPLFTVAAILTLALGLGVNSAVLSIANTIFVKPLRLRDPSGLVLVHQRRPNRPTTNSYPLSYPDYLYFRDHTRTFASLAAHYATSPMHVSRAEGGFEVTGSVVTVSYFETLRLRPFLGRFFRSEEDRIPGRNPVAVLGHDLWRSRFGGDPRILGAVVRINGTDFTVVGVAPERFRGIQLQDPVDIWIPTAMFRVGYRYCDGLARECPIVNLVGRLADGASMQDAQAELALLARQLETAFPQTNTGRGVVVRPARGIRADEQAQNRWMVAMLAAAGALVMLVASANVAGLLLARGLRRRKEIAIRLALGASRYRVIQQLLIESMLLSVAGGAAGLLVASWSTDAGRAFLGSAGNADFSLDPRLVAVAFAIALTTGLVTGVAPALQSTRVGPLHALKDDTPGAGSGRTRVRDGLIVVQMAASVLLLTVSGLLVRSFVTVHHGPGFDPNAIVTVRLRPSLVGYSAERSWAFQREAIRRIEAIPGVLAASPAGTLPLPRWAMGSAAVTTPGDAGGRAEPFEAATTYVGPRYFETIGVPLVEGREFDDRDRNGPPLAIVNETLARRFWPRGGAAGSAVMLGATRVEVVGVVKNFEYVTALEQPRAIAYLDFWQQDTTQNWSHDSRTHIRVAGDAAALIPQIRRAIAAVDADVPVLDAQALSVAIDTAFSQVRAARAFLLTFGALAMVLSTIGLYASLAFAVGQRTRELAIRMALGAARIDVGWLVLHRGAVLVLSGVVLGLLGTALAGPFLAHLLYGVSPRDPVALLAPPSLVVMVALVAMWLPARRAMALDPMTALRSE
jgi:putative ABC transport system permease protein